MTFKVHTIDSAPQEARATLEKVKAQYGFVPNVMGVFAEAPPLLDAYLSLNQLIRKTSFSAVERLVVLLTISAENGCGYCMAAHSKEAEADEVPIEVLDDLRAGSPISDERLEALRQYTTGVMHNRGRPSDEVKGKFLEAGFGPRQALEIVMAIGMKTLSNYTNNLAHTPLDDQFKETEWKQDQAA